MASAYGFDISPGGQGAIFALSASAKRNRRQTFGMWEAELRKDSNYVCVRGSVLNLQEPLADVIEAAHGVAEDLLDILAVEERNALLVIEPRNNLVWRSGPQGLKLQLTSGITFGAEGSGALVVTNAAGEVIPDPPYMPPQHHFAYRYFRYSQAAQNVLGAYRNMFLAFESLLDYVDFGHSGFASLLSGLVTLLVISVADCPTIEKLEQLVAKREKGQCCNFTGSP